MDRYINRYIAWMAWRHVSSRKRSGLSFMTTISVAGVAIGVAALVVVLSVMGGFEMDLRSKMFRGLPNVEIVAEDEISGFSLKENPVSQFEALHPGIVDIEPFTKADVVLKRKKHLVTVTLYGVEPERGGRLWGFGGAIIQGQLADLSVKHMSVNQDLNGVLELPGIILSEAMAANLGATVGDDVLVLSPQATLRDALAGYAMTRRYVVVGLFRSDLPRFDTKYAVVSLPEGRKFMADYDESLDEEQYVSGIAFNMKNPDDVDALIPKLAALKGFTLQTWKTVNKALLFALKLEKFTMGSILLLIVVVAAFSISGTLMMSVYHRRNQVALLRSLGMSEQEVGQLFVYQGLTIGTIGVLVGLIFGIGLCTLIYYFQFIDLPAGVYYQKKLPVKFLPLEYGVICISAWILALVAAVYPALTAARQDPGIGLRYR